MRVPIVCLATVLLRLCKTTVARKGTEERFNKSIEHRRGDMLIIGNVPSNGETVRQTGRAPGGLLYIVWYAVSVLPGKRKRGYDSRPPSSEHKPAAFCPV